VIKDAGNDPDTTHGAEICARVTWRKTLSDPKVIVRGGLGVGMVTKPGLEVPPGRHAINPGPLKMIRHAVLETMAAFDRRGTVEVEITVPRGEGLAQRTLNARLGIIGGISLLGTTGIVRPLSHKAYTATIRSALASGQGCRIETGGHDHRPP
jgi:cobalt-precorrin-5B (C1)-methyltransferase